MWRRLREEAPLYYNDEHDFFALSRFDGVEKGLTDWKTYSSAKGMLLEIIKVVIEQGIEIPPAKSVRRPADPRRSPQHPVPGLHTEEDAHR